MGSAKIPVHLPRAVRDVIIRQIREHRSATALSTSRAVREVRRQFPDLSVKDRDLADIIAQAAVDSGIVVYLDGVDEQS